MATGMASAKGEGGSAKPRPISALPSVQARLLAFGAIVIAGICGGLIGYSTVKVGCHGKCGTPEGVGGITGAVIATIGVSVIAVLVLRAMGEWRSIKEKRQLELVIAAAGAFTPSGDRPATADVPPAASEPEVEAGVAEPAAGVAPVEPAPAEPVTAEPVTTEPVTAEPVTTEPVTTEPVTAEPVTAEPATPPPSGLTGTGLPDDAPPELPGDTAAHQDPPV
jgi:predicted lipid-binding transport protein (Tim44 family)